MYDVTDRESFENVRQWMHEIERQNTLCYLVLDLQLRA